MIHLLFWHGVLLAILGAFILAHNPYSLQVRIITVQIYILIIGIYANFVFATTQNPEHVTIIALINLVINFAWAIVATVLTYLAIFHEPILHRRFLIPSAIILALALSVVLLLKPFPEVTHEGTIYTYTTFPLRCMVIALGGFFASLGIFLGVIITRQGRDRSNAILILLVFVFSTILSGARFGNAETRLLIAVSSTLPGVIIVFYLTLYRQLFTPVRTASELIAHNLEDAIIISDNKGIVIWLNAAAEKVLGVTTEAIQQRELHTFLAQHSLGTGSSNLLDMVQSSTHINASIECELALTTASKERMYHVTIVPLFTEDNERNGSLMQLSDVSDYRAREQTLLRQNTELVASREQLEAAMMEQQRLNETVRHMSLPIIPIAERIIVMPLVGVLDSNRALALSETLLRGIEQYNAKVALIDITGVPLVDSQVALSFVRAIEATRLLGAHVLLVGVRPEIAATLVNIGADVEHIETSATLQAGLLQALRLLGQRVVSTHAIGSVR